MNISTSLWPSRCLAWQKVSGSELLESLAADRTLLLAIDGSEAGRKCLVLIVSVIYKKRSLPIAWIVVTGN